MTNQYKSNHMTKTMIGYFQDYAFIELWAPQLQNISLLCNMFKQAGILVICSLTALAHFWAESGGANSKDGFPNKLPGYGTENGQKTGHIECFEFVVLQQFIFILQGLHIQIHSLADAASAAVEAKATEVNFGIIFEQCLWITSYLLLVCR